MPWEVGNKSRCICKHCKELVHTTVQLKSIKLDNEVYHGILCGVCDRCGRIVSLAQVVRPAKTA